MPVPTRLSPDQRSKQRLEFYNSLKNQVDFNRAYKIAEILVKPPEALTSADRAQLLSGRSSIEAAVGSIDAYLGIYV